MSAPTHDATHDWYDSGEEEEAVAVAEEEALNDDDDDDDCSSSSCCAMMNRGPPPWREEETAAVSKSATTREEERMIVRSLVRSRNRPVASDSTRRPILVCCWGPFEGDDGKRDLDLGVCCWLVPSLA